MSPACWLAVLVTVLSVAHTTRADEATAPPNCLIGHYSRFSYGSDSGYQQFDNSSIYTLTLGEKPHHLTNISTIAGGGVIYFYNFSVAMAIGCPQTHPVGPSGSGGGSSSYGQYYIGDVFDIEAQKVTGAVTMGTIPQISSFIVNVVQDTSGRPYWLIMMQYGVCWTLNTLGGSIQEVSKGCIKKNKEDVAQVTLINGGSGVAYAWRNPVSGEMFMIARGPAEQQFRVLSNGSISGWDALLTMNNRISGQVVDEEKGIVSFLVWGRNGKESNITLYTTSNIYTNGTITVTPVGPAIALPDGTYSDSAYCDGSTWYVLAEIQKKTSYNTAIVYTVGIDGSNVQSYPEMVPPGIGSRFTGIICQ